MFVYVCCFVCFKRLTSFWVSKVSDLNLSPMMGLCVMLPGRILDLAQHKSSGAFWATAPWWGEAFSPSGLLSDVHTPLISSELSWFQWEAELGHPGAHPANFLVCSHSCPKFQDPGALQAPKRPPSSGWPTQVTAASVNSADVPSNSQGRSPAWPLLMEAPRGDRNSALWCKYSVNVAVLGLLAKYSRIW